MKKSTTSPHVLAFAEIMEQKLADNRHKGDREGWLGCSLSSLGARLREEVEELKLACNEATGSEFSVRRIEHEAADVANFAMMIADKARFEIITSVPEASRP